MLRENYFTTGYYATVLRVLRGDATEARRSRDVPPATAIEPVSCFLLPHLKLEHPLNYLSLNDDALPAFFIIFRLPVVEHSAIEDGIDETCKKLLRGIIRQSSHKVRESLYQDVPQA